MTHIYFAASYQRKSEFREIYDLLIHEGHVLSAPIYDYQISGEIDYRSLMEHAFSEIKKCDLVVADATYKEIGIGIEVGYARALGKRILYIRRRGSDISTTVLGTADNVVEYNPTHTKAVIDLI